jgi:hypothetical protein
LPFSHVECPEFRATVHPGWKVCVGTLFHPSATALHHSFFRRKCLRESISTRCPPFEEMPKIPMTEAAITQALPPADFGVSAICVGAPVERDEQDVQEEDMEEQDVGGDSDMGESDGPESSEDAVEDLTASTEGASGAVRGGRVRTPSVCHSGAQWTS